eukprot:jgi/Botrbrau1/2399/Bobra.0395s0029.3
MHSLLRRSVVRQPHFATSELPRNTSHLRNVERTIASLLPGATFATIKTFDSSDVDLFARLTGDENPIHISSNTASSDGANAVLPGILCASLFPAVIGSQFPGALYLKQSLNFRRVAQKNKLWDTNKNR